MSMYLTVGSAVKALIATANKLQIQLTENMN